MIKSYKKRRQRLSNIYDYFYFVSTPFPFIDPIKSMILDYSSKEKKNLNETKMVSPHVVRTKSKKEIRIICLKVFVSEYSN